MIFYLVTSTSKFDLLLKNFNLGHNSQTRSDGLSYFTCVFLWQDLACGTIIFDLVTLTLKFGLLLKNLNLWCYLVMVAARRASLSSDNSYCTNFVLYDYTPRKRSFGGGGVYRNHPVCLSVRLSVQSKLNLDHNFLTKGDRSSILHKCIPCDKTFLSIPKFLTSWPWPWLLTYFWKKLNLGHNFLTKRDRAFIFRMCISCGKTFL